PDFSTSQSLGVGTQMIEFPSGSTAMPLGALLLSVSSFFQPLATGLLSNDSAPVNLGVNDQWVKGSTCSCGSPEIAAVLMGSGRSIFGPTAIIGPCCCTGGR